jgi:hypothetical protein
VTEAEAVAVAEGARSARGFEACSEVLDVGRRWIEVTDRDSSGEAWSRDVLVWVVRMGRPRSVDAVDVAIDDRTGEIVRLARSQ